MQTLLIDGVRYTLRAYKDEDELEAIVEEHARDIFGPNSLYFNLKRRISSGAGVVSIPDGYVLDFPGSSWYVVEVELAAHNLYEHIVPQVHKFVNGLASAASRAGIVDSLYNEILASPLRAAEAKAQVAPTELHKALSDLVAKTPTLVIVIDEASPVLGEVLEVLSIGEKRVVEMQAFQREGVGPSVHAHLFKPVKERRPSTPGRPTLRSLIENGLLEVGTTFLGIVGGRTYAAEVLADGRLRLEDGRIFETPSGAGKAVTPWVAVDGWRFWRYLDSTTGEWEYIDALRKRFMESSEAKV